MDEFEYFVSFAYRRGGYESRFGNVRVTRPQPIRDTLDISEIELEIARTSGAQYVSVITWRRFECGPDEWGSRG